MGARPSRRLPTAEDARLLAKRRLPRIVFDFIDGAAGMEAGAARNRDGFADLGLMPRVLVDVEPTDASTTFLGRRYGLPVGIAPMGMCDLAWPGTDRVLAAEAARRDLPLCVSTATSTPLEEMARLTGGRAWFQLYVTGSVETAMGFVDRAASAGYEVLVLTVDVPKLGRRPRDLRGGFETPFRLNARRFLDFALHPAWSIGTLRAGVPRMANYGSAAAAGYDRKAPRSGANWEFLARLRERWRGKLVVKGVMSPEDARRIRDAGADAVYVSNHGGRQLESAPATIAALPAIRAAVGPDFPLLIDGGIRSGEDVVKALASGADFVLLGRPFLFAVAADGARGLTSFLDGLAADVGIAMAQIGVTRIRDIDRGALVDVARPLPTSSGSGTP